MLLHTANLEGTRAQPSPLDSFSTLVKTTASLLLIPCWEWYSCLFAGAGSHEYGWRDLYDGAVRWRQAADPYDPVFYGDGLSQRTMDVGVVLGTYMLHKEMRVNKYFTQARALKLLTSLLHRSLHSTMPQPNVVDWLSTSKRLLGARVSLFVTKTV